MGELIVGASLLLLGMILGVLGLLFFKAMQLTDNEDEL